MTVSAPPRPPHLDERHVDPEALIREARRRARRRRLRNLTGAVAVALGALWLYTIVAGGGAHSPVSTLAQDASAALPKTALPEALSYTTGSGVTLVHRDGTRERLIDPQLERSPDGLIRERYGFYGIEWSPDGSKLLAYQSGHAPSLVLVDAVGHFATFARGASVGHWSPDGSRIAFIKATRGAGDAILVASSDGERAIRVGSFAQYGLSSLSWSPDGTQIVYAGRKDTGLFIADASGRKPARPIRIASGLSKGVAEAHWSPDGSVIAFRSGSALNLVRPDGTGFRTIADDYRYGLAWSPDGRFLAVLGPAGLGNWGGVAVMRRDGSGLRRVGQCACTLRGPGFAASLAWSSDGTRVAFVSGKGDTVSTVRRDGSGEARVAAQPAHLPGHDLPWWPLWRPHS